MADPDLDPDSGADADLMADPAPAAVATRPPGLGGALWLSGIRCLVTYVALPLAGPALGLLSPLATGLVVALAVAAAAVCTRLAWRSWRDGRHGRCLLACSLLSLNLAGLAGRLG